MEVKKGYKQTELGLIPEDWDITKIGNLLEFKNGLNKGSEFFGYGTPIINYMDVFRYNGIKVSDVKGKVFLNSQEKNSFSAKKGDVFFTRTSEIPEEIGMASVLLEEIPDCVFSGFILRGRPKNNKITSEYFQYCLVPSYVRRQIISTSSYTTRALTNGRYLSNVKILFPSSLPEQTAIATALSDMDALIAQTEKLIEKKKAMKQGMMQELLKPKKGWVTKTIKEIVKTPVTDGPHETPEFVSNGIPFLSVNNIVDNRINYSDLRFISIEDDLRFSRKCKPQKDDILLGKAASVGKVALVYSEWDFNIWSPLALIRVKNEYSCLYTYYYFQTSDIKNQIEGLTNSSSQGNIGMKDIEKLILSFPEKVTERIEIGLFLSDLDSVIISKEILLQKLKLQKQGMMQELLTGRIRLL